MSVSSTLVVRGMNNDQKGITYKVKEPMIVGRSRSCDILYRMFEHLDSRPAFTVILLAFFTSRIWGV